MAANNERKKRKAWFGVICQTHGRSRNPNDKNEIKEVRTSVKGIRADKYRGCPICTLEQRQAAKAANETPV